MKVKIKRKISNSLHILKTILMMVIVLSFGAIIFSSELNKTFSKVHKFFKPDKKINQELEGKIKKLTEGYPIEKMSSEIAKQDVQVAAFLIAIAKKESNWGERTPKYKGKECYNYWGFRRRRLFMGSGGHTCFNNPKDAVETVAERIENLIAKGVDTPREMVIWKCGRCNGPASISAGKWIRDVRYYYNLMMQEK